MDGETRLAAFRLPTSLLRRVDRYAANMVVNGKPGSRADAVRDLLTNALDDNDRLYADARESMRAIAKTLSSPIRKRRQRR
jgi:Arc/MetJ-type ribon-helix-helix transcriptional regulator